MMCERKSFYSISKRIEVTEFFYEYDTKKISAEHKCAQRMFSKDHRK